MSTRLATTGENGSDGQRVGRSILVAPADHDLTVIIPTYNEVNRLPRTLVELVSFLDNWGVDYRVIVADDGSTDATAGLTSNLGPRCSTLRIIPHGGKGRAVRIAMLRATGRVLAFTDADLPFRLSALRQGYQSIRDGYCDVVFGARDVVGADSWTHRRIARRFATFVFRSIVSRFVSREVTDTQCGLKLFARPAALDIFGRATIDGFAFDADVVMLTHQLGLRFRRMPVTLINDFASKLSLSRNALPMLFDVMRIWFRQRTGRTMPAPHLISVAADKEQQQRAA